MKWMLVCYRDDDTVVVRLSNTERFGPPFEEDEAGTFEKIVLYRRVGSSHAWKRHAEWGHMCADENWDVMYHREGKIV
jgi:hypothetical protein